MSCKTERSSNKSPFFCFLLIVLIQTEKTYQTLIVCAISLLGVSKCGHTWSFALILDIILLRVFVTV